MIAEYPLIPTSAFLYMPPRQKKIEFVDKRKLRVIFGNTTFDQDQKIKIQEFRALVQKKTKYAYLNAFGDDNIIKFLQASNFQHQNTVCTLEKFYNWQSQILPLQISPKTQDLLKKGILYVSGRDCFYRPIVIVNVKKILDLKIPKEDLLQCLSFFFQYVIENMMIQGQVQQWALINDLGNASIFSLGKSMLDIISHMSSIFKVRTTHNFLLNCPSSIKMLWGSLKSTLNEDQIRKISMSQKKHLKPQNFQLINPLQVQQKYGGHLPDITQYWPIQVNHNSVQTQDQIKHHKNLLTEHQYDKMFENNQLQNVKIKKCLIKRFQEKQNQKMYGQEDRMTQKDEDSVRSEEAQKQNFPAQSQTLPTENHKNRFSFRNIFGHICGRMPRRKQ